MNKLLQILAPVIASCLLAGSVRADDAATTVECVKSGSFLAPLDSPDRLKYAPDREVQVMHLALDITPDFKQRTIQGSAAIQFKPLLKPVQEIKLDAVDLTIDSVSATEKILGHQSTDDKLIVTFADLIPTEKEVTVTVTYHAEPTAGIYFRTPEMGYKEGDTHLFSQGEEIDSRHWYPCFDSPNEKFTSDVTCRVPEGMSAISNGRLVSEETDAVSGLKVIHWSQEKPHANYLVTLVAGYFKKLEDKHKDTPLAFLVPPSEFNEASNSFRDTKDIMEFFEQDIGVTFPWAKYDQICVNDFVEGGMENTSATTLTDSTLFRDETENIFNSESLVSHEMAHQWFGDLVTCKDWSHIWLNEGFATYYQLLYDGHKNGRDSMIYGLYRNAQQITGMPNDTNAIVRRSYDSPHDMFGYLAYPKGGWVLHMLRSQLGDELYRKCIKTYLERHQYGNVTTEDLREVIEEFTGRSYDQFFDQWVYHAHHPELEVSYSWDERTKLAKVSVQQTQKTSENVLLFNFPLTIRFKGKFGKIDRTVQVKDKQEEFSFPLDATPEIVRIDPDYTILCTINFTPPGPMLDAQLADKDDMMGRLLAVRELNNKKEKSSVAKLKKVLNGDSFYPIRVEAARGLRLIHSDEALEALLASMKQSDAHVRLAVVQEISGFYRDSAFEAANGVLAKEKNPLILMAAIRGLGGYSKPEVHGVLLKYLTTPSYQNEFASAAIGAMRSQDDPVYIAPLMDALSKHEEDYIGRSMGQGLGALAYLARNEDKKDAVREFLISHVNDKKLNVQLAAINGCGTLGDPKAIAVLEKFTSGLKDTPDRGAADQAIATLRAHRAPIDDFKNMRQEIADLQKENREMRKELDDLKKKVATTETTPANAPQKKKKAGSTSSKGN